MLVAGNRVSRDRVRCWQTTTSWGWTAGTVPSSVSAPMPPDCARKSSEDGESTLRVFPYNFSKMWREKRTQGGGRRIHSFACRGGPRGGHQVSVARSPPAGLSAEEGAACGCGSFWSGGRSL